MNLGVWMCIVLVPGFAGIGLLFAIFREKAAKFVSGFESLSRQERDLCDKAALAKDVRNSCFLWAAVMLIGALGAYFLTGYAAVFAFIVWGILFFKDVHIDAHKAFEKYLDKDK